MADTIRAAAYRASEHINDTSFWARKFKITSFKIDPARWNKDWERALHTLRLSSRDVYTNMVQRVNIGPRGLDTTLLLTRFLVCRLQEKLSVVCWGGFDSRHQEYFRTAWLLLDEKERKRHLLKGLVEACKHSIGGQDLRAICPEITVSSMLTLKGRPFTDLLDACCMGKKGVGQDNTYFHPSEWWNKAKNDLSQSLSERFDPSLFLLMTLRRNEFICECIYLAYNYCCT
jgi:hypothetical protein